MYRKRPFTIRRRGRLPVSAAVCRIPCLILCLADVERVCPGHEAGRHHVLLLRFSTGFFHREPQIQGSRRLATRN